MRGTLGPWYVDTPRSPAEIAAFLRAYAPWRMALEFPGGLRSEDYGPMEPWNNVPTRKAQLFADIIPEETLRGQRILDVGSNSGHSALYLSQEFGCIATGIDFDGREVERAQWIADAIGAPARFWWLTLRPMRSLRRTQSSCTSARFTTFPIRYAL